MSPLPKQWQQLASIGLAGGVLLVLALLPFGWPLLELLEREADELVGGLSALASSQLWILLARSVSLACAVVLGTLAIGIPLGILFARTNVIGRRVLLVIHAFPLFVPPFLLALGWFYLFGRQGFVGTDATAAIVFSQVGHVIVLSLALAPVVTMLVVLGLWNLDPSLEEAARVEARPLRVATGILLPVVWPSILLAVIIVFALAFSELGVAMFLRVEVYPAAVLARLGGIDYDPAEAFLLALPLFPIVLAVLVLERRLFRDRPFDVLGVRYRSRPPLLLGRWRFAASMACWIIALVSLAPLLSLALRAALGSGFAELDRWIGNSLINSLLGSSLAATLIVSLGFILGHGRARLLPGSRLFDLVAVLAFVTPAALLGAGMIAVWNRPDTRFIYGGLGIIVLGLAARYAVIGIRAVAVAVAQTPPSLEQAAAAFGAGYAQRMFKIVLPLHGRGIAAVWFLALVFCLRDLETVVLYYPPGWEPLTVRIFTLEANGPEPIVAALAVVQVLLTAVVLAMGGLLLAGRSRP